ncbi:MAG: nonstructural protein [Microviridae sp.]|nr:MAG: nonstructural protein [Microviridae sp.]
MDYRIFSVFDVALGAYGRPMFLQSKGQAVRSFSDEVNRRADDNQMNRHPEDFQLFDLGSFSEDTGLFLTIAPERIALAADLIIEES